MTNRRNRRKPAVTAPSALPPVAPTAAENAGLNPSPIAPAASAEQRAADPPATPASLADELRGLTKNLLWLSESEALMTVVELPKDAILPDALRALAALPLEAPAEEWAIADLLSPATGPDQPDPVRFAALQVFLETKLIRAVAYKLGTIKKPLFFIGRQPDKTWLAVQTEAVET